MKLQHKPDIHFNHFQRKVAENIVKPVRTLDDLEKFLVRWWCQYYKKPFQCDEILDYTLEELLYEYLTVYYSHNVDEARKILSKDEQSDDEKWLKQMMGGKYMSQKEQEETLKPMKTTIKESMDSEDTKLSDEFNLTFNDFEDYN